MKNKLCERVVGKELHVYINDDRTLYNDKQTLWASYDGEELAYGINLEGKNVEEGLDWFMGLFGRDTQNWFYNDIVIHWGNNVWKFYNARNISDFTKEEWQYFDKDDYDI